MFSIIIKISVKVSIQLAERDERDGRSSPDQSYFEWFTLKLERIYGEEAQKAILFSGHCLDK